MICANDQKEMRLVPAGVSKKSGKSYPEFWVCDEKTGGCGKTFNPPREDSTGVETPKKRVSKPYSTPSYAENQAKKEDGMAFLNASRGAVEIVVAKMSLLKNVAPDNWIAEEVKRWTNFLYEMNVGKDVKPAAKVEKPEVHAPSEEELKSDSIQF